MNRNSHKNKDMILTFALNIPWLINNAKVKKGPHAHARNVEKIETTSKSSDNVYNFFYNYI